MRTILTSAICGAVLAAGGLATGCGTSAPASQPGHATRTTPSAATTPAPSPTPTADAKGTYQGSCDYTLSNSANGDDYLVGEIDLKNTGNVGGIVKTRITWPQEGALPITARKTARLPFGASKVVRFRINAGNVGNSNVIDLLQSWQDRHNGNDGCTYYVKFVGTFGPTHS